MWYVAVDLISFVIVGLCENSDGVLCFIAARHCLTNRVDISYLRKIPCHGFSGKHYSAIVHLGCEWNFALLIYH